MTIPPTEVPPDLVPEDEERRLESLYSYEILDTPPERAFDDLTSLASYICGTSMASLTLIDATRQWFKSAIGLGANETPRDGFCAHCVLQEDILVVSNAMDDPRFDGHPFVIGDPNIRFYAGVTLVSPEGYALGTLCAIDPEPKTLSAAQADALRALGRQTMAQLELRRLAARDRLRVAELTELYRQAVATATAGTAPSEAPASVGEEIPSLTGHERRILALAAQGLTNPEIGERLYLSRHTVKDYLGDAMRKLGAGSRVEAALKAVRLGLIEDLD
jgi:DNA-binding CsgD family transcriptional regulator